MPDRSCQTPRRLLGCVNLTPRIVNTAHGSAGRRAGAALFGQRRYGL